MIGAVIFIKEYEFSGSNLATHNEDLYFRIISSYKLSFNGEGTLFFYVEIY